MAYSSKEKSVSYEAENRIWIELNTISKNLKELVRIGERVDNHGEILQRHLEKLDNLERRIQESELWRAEFGDKDKSNETISELRNQIEDLKSKSDKNETIKEIAFQFGRWGVSLAIAFSSAYVAYIMKTGSL